MRHSLLKLSAVLVFLGLGPIGVNGEDEWGPMTVPGGWENREGFEELDGFGWYRAVVTVPASWEGRRLLLTVQSVDDVDEAYFNGDKVGANGSMPPLYGDPSSDVRRPAVIDPDQVRYGRENLIAFRVYDKGGAGGILKGPIQLAGGDEAIDLAGVWDFRAGDDPVFARWPDPNGDGREFIDGYEKRTGAKRAGSGGLVPADLEGRRKAVAEVAKRYENNRNVHSNLDGKGKPKTPAEALEALVAPDPLEIDLVLAEPIVRQPLFVDFDERGRMWVTQYIQYPNPAGLEVLIWDNHMRIVFDAVPPPPPYRKPEHRKFIGQDRITIHEDKDGDGVFDDHKVFLEGLNIATSTVRGRGGVWVLNAPYLLFYADANNDDVPDGDPVVHLSGFGLEDTHSVANSLKWGPDGWLYGATGSTVTARIRAVLNPEQKPLHFFGQTIWRYQPEDHRFEIFGDGGYNNFGVDFDDEGRVYSGTNGRMQAVHFVQGGYYRKGFGKHGPHTNPYAFNYFDAMPLDGDKSRMVHQWLLYGGGALPGYEGHLIGANSLSNFVADLKATPIGSSFTTVEGPKLISTDDKWFRPIHSTTGPDGAVYISDFYDGRITHLDPRDNWDRERGRIYRLRHRDHQFVKPFNLGAESSVQLVERLKHKNRWFRETARRLLADRMDHSVGPALLEKLRNDSGQLALESLWALHSLGLLTDDLALEGLAHANPQVRLWTARLLADRGQRLASPVAARLFALAGEDRDPEVISQLAASAQRLPSEQGIPLVVALTNREGFTSDPQIPLQLWWAWEAQFTRDREAVLASLKEPVWQTPLFQEAVVKKLARRVTSESAEKNLGYAARLLQLAPDVENRNRLIDGLEAGLQGQSLARIPDEARSAFDQLWSSAEQKDFRLIRFAMRLANPDAVNAARSFVRNPEAERGERGQLIGTLAELKDDKSLVTILDLATAEEEDQNLRVTAMNALRRFSDPSIPERLLKSLPSLQGDLAYTAQAILAGRKDWAGQLLGAVSTGAIKRETVRYENLLLMKSLGAPDLSEAIELNFGTLRQPAEEKEKKMEAVRLTLATGPGDEKNGREVFKNSCAICHRLHGEGKEIGPDLTGYERDNLEFLITAVVDPNLAVREEYEMATITLRPGKTGGEPTVLAGFVTSLSNASVTLRDLAGNLSVISRKDILSENRSAVSMMPEGLLNDMKPADLRDLFAYLGKK